MLRILANSTILNKRLLFANTKNTRYKANTYTIHHLVSSAKQKKYILSQFPYPSGELHLGHARVYYIGDTLSRYYKIMQNWQVIYPIGFDSFGLPAENAAILHKKDPKQWTQTNIEQMKKQLSCLEIDFDWDCQFATHTKQYYKWTQLIFLYLYKNRLCYRSESQVNWDPIDKTVLANQQVDNQGRSWRSGALVQKKMLQQWVFGITKYAEELQNGLKELQWIERVKSMQNGWIGVANGWMTKAKVQWNNNTAEKNRKQIEELKKMQQIQFFISNKEDLTKQYFIRYNSKLNSNEGQKNDCKQSQIIGFIIDPLDQSKINKIPIIFGNQQNGIAFELVPKLQPKSLNKKQKAKSHQTSENKTDWKKLDRLDLKHHKAMRIRDWSISRQRYWGCPIPIIYCEKCGTQPVPENDLPVELPSWKNKGNPLLNEQFKRCKCPKCQGSAIRQTDTMDTFVDSSWYFLRFLDPRNQKYLCAKQLADRWMPVDIYIGGIQHAIMHLLYARFIMRVLSDLGVSTIKEPFKQLVVQGLVKGKTIKHKTSGKYLKIQQAKNYQPSQLQQTFQKMSKSKFNGLNPTSLVQKYGPDALRISLFFAAPPEHDIDFHQDLLVAAQRFLKKVQETHKNLFLGQQSNIKSSTYDFTTPEKLRQQLKNVGQILPDNINNIKQTIMKLQSSLQKRHMHVYVASAMEMFNQLKSIEKSHLEQIQPIRFIFTYVFIPVLSIIAPKLIKSVYHTTFSGQNRQLTKFYKILWPKSGYFQDSKQYLIMKGNKLIKKGIIQINDLFNQKISSNKAQQSHEKQLRQTIMAKLNIKQDIVAIKNNKKNIVILVK